MKKIRHILIVTIGFMLLGFRVFSQGNLPYTQGYADAEFLSISQTGTVILNSFEEPHTIPLVVEGFDFNYNGFSYHNFYVSPQGWISLGLDATSQASVSNNLTELNQPILSPLWDMFNLLGQNGSTYNILYKVETINNENVLVIEWSDMQWMDYAASFDAGSKISFQVKLYQTSKRIEYCYQSPNSILFWYDPTAGIYPDNVGASIGISDVNYPPMTYMSENYTQESVRLNSFENFNSKVVYYEQIPAGSGSGSEGVPSATSITVTQSGSNVYPEEQDKIVLKISMGVVPGVESSVLNQLKFSLKGTSSLYDIQNAKLYYATSNDMQQAELKSTIGTINTDSLIFNFSNFTLPQGTNYFWLTVDVNQHAIEGNLIDASLVSVMFGAVNKLLNSSPSGSLLILNNSSVAGRGINASDVINTADFARNWTEQTTYKEDGSILNVSRTYFDNLGRTTQQQSNTGGTILASQTVYDLFGRSGIQTLPAVRENVSSIVYDENFITNGNNAEFSYADFDLYAKRITPSALNASSTLAKYYSSSNTMEPYVASSSFPYSRIDYVGDATSRVQTQTLAGESFKLGTTHQAAAFDMLSAGELTYVYGAYRSYVQDNLRTDTLNSSTELAKATKVVTIDADGKVSVAFYGPNNILVAKCLSGIANSGCVSQKVAQSMVYNIFDKNKFTNTIDIHLPKSKNNTLSFSVGDHATLLPSNFIFEFYDLLNKKKLVYGTDYITSLVSGKYQVQFLSNAYQSRDNFLRFSVNLKPNSFNLNHITNGDKLDCAFFVNYELDYSNWTANYYDCKLNLISSIQPKDIDCNYDPLSNLNTIKGSSLLVASSTSTLNTPLASIGVAGETANDRQLKMVLKPVIDLNSSSAYSMRANATLINSISVTDNGSVLEILNKNEVGEYGTISQECENEINPQVFYKKKLKLNFNIYGIPEGQNSSPEFIDKYEMRFTLIGYTVKDCNIAKYSLINDYRKTIGLDNEELKNYSEVEIISDGISIYDVFNDKDSHTQEYSVYNDGNDEHKYINEPFSSVRTLFDVVKLKLEYEINTYPHTSLLNYSNVYKNKYDGRSRVIESTTQDEGKTRMVYNADNQIRFTQNELQWASDKFTYINYDKSGRVIETGEYDPTIFDENGSHYYFFETEDKYTGATYADKISVVSIANATGMFNPVRCTNRSFIAYDIATNDLPTNIGSGYNPKYLAGRVAKTWNDENITWYGYEYDGKLSWLVQGQSELGTKTIDYTYDYWGNVLSTEYQKGSNSERLKYIYTYDNYLRLLDVSTVRGVSNTPKLQARYSYYKHGPLKRKEIGNKIQGVDYVYTINGWLKSINEPSLTNRDPGKDGYAGDNSLFKKDVFGMSIDYFNNDYVRAGALIQNQLTAESAVDNYDGKIKAVNWKTQTPTNSNAQYGTSMLSFIYSYDKQGQLTSATFGTNTVSTASLTSSTLYVADNFSALPEYNVFNIAYDRNGNLTTLSRNGNVNTNNYLKDNLTYNYSSSTGNRLLSVTDVATDNDAIDFVPPNTSSSPQFEYDELGRMVVDHTKNISITYNLLGKVSEIYDLGSNALKIKYAYNERGQKIRKTVYPDNENNYYRTTTHYFNDVQGNVLSIYTDTRLENTSPKVNLAEQTIYGMGRVGVIYTATSQTVYELTDHLGNVRATVSDSEEGVTAEVLSYTDYYPHGSVMPGRHYTSSTMYRYDYQGIEKDQETNWNNFELRMYDANLGRWMSPDPYGEFFSPYLAMGNNPVSTVDPDGGKILRSGLGADAPEVDYTGRERPVDPFDMVGGSGGLSAAYSNFEDLSEAQEFESWGGSGEGDFRRMVITEAMINLQKIMSEYNNKQESEKQNAMYSDEKVVTSSEIEQSFLLLLGESSIDFKNKGNDIESILRIINSQPLGAKMTGKEIVEINKKLTIVGDLINNIEKVKGGIKVDINWKGIAALKITPHSIPDGSIFKIENVKLKNYGSAIRMSSVDASLYGNPFNIYIKKNTYSFYGNSFDPIFK